MYEQTTCCQLVHGRSLPIPSILKMPRLLINYSICPQSTIESEQRYSLCGTRVSPQSSRVRDRRRVVRLRAIRQGRARQWPVDVCDVPKPPRHSKVIDQVQSVSYLTGAAFLIVFRTGPPSGRSRSCLAGGSSLVWTRSEFDLVLVLNPWQDCCKPLQ